MSETELLSNINDYLIRYKDDYYDLHKPSNIRGLVRNLNIDMSDDILKYTLSDITYALRQIFNYMYEDCGESMCVGEKLIFEKIEKHILADIGIILERIIKEE